MIAAANRIDQEEGLEKKFLSLYSLPNFNKSWFFVDFDLSLDSLPEISDLSWKAPLIRFGTSPIAKVAAGVLAFAAASAGTGKLLKLAGRKVVAIGEEDNSFLSKNRTAQIGNILEQVGDGIFLMGRYSFLSLAVPTYTATWVLPKWAFEEGLPKLVELTEKHIIIPLWNDAVLVANFINDATLRIVKAIYNRALVPLGQALERAALWTWNTVVIPLSRQVERVAKATYETILKPLSHKIEEVVKWTWNRVIVPLAKKSEELINAIANRIEELAEAFYEQVLEPLGEATLRAGKWIWRAVLIPIVDRSLQIALSAVNKVLDAAEVVYKRLIEPLGNATLKAAKWTWEKIVVPVTRYAKDTIIDAMRAIYKNVLKPLSQTTLKAAKWTWNEVILPTAESIKTATARTARAIHQYVLQPLTALTKKTAKWVWNTIGIPILDRVLQITGMVKNALVRTAQAIYNIVILPTSQFSMQILETTYSYTKQICQGIASAGLSIMDTVHDVYSQVNEKLAWAR